MIAVALAAILAVGCIQPQQSHTGQCPTGVATQSKWLMRGLDPTLKSARLANYLVTLRKDLLTLGHACGKLHPALVPLDALDILDGEFGTRPARDVFRYQQGWGLPKLRERGLERATSYFISTATEPPPR